jgi:cytosine/adenosine deaminase-related metal-dependent hydrolase
MNIPERQQQQCFWRMPDGKRVNQQDASQILSESGSLRLHVRRLLTASTSVMNVEVHVNEGMITEIRQLPDHRAGEADPVALIPQLVNGHTHLEFSDRVGSVEPSTPFTAWIQAVISERKQSAGSGIPRSVAIEKGIEECHRYGVVGIGEITTSSAVDLAISSHKHSRKFQTQQGPPSEPSPIVSFREFIGLRSDAASTAGDAVTQHLADCRNAGVRPGISPHAPYSVHPDLFDALMDAAWKHELPAAMHLAETMDERELLETGQGRFRDFLQSMNLWNPEVFPGGRSIMPFLSRMAELPRALAVHCNYADSTELRFLADHSNVAVVYCPRTHRFFGHTPHPWMQLLAAGGRVILGTDSRASSPDLNLWADLQMAALESLIAGSVVSAERLISMVTTEAAESLGLEAVEFDLQLNRPFRGILVRDDSDAIQSHTEWMALAESQPIAFL